MTNQEKDKLLRAMIAEWCKVDGVIITAVWLLEYGLTKEELINEFGFDKSDVNTALEQVDVLRSMEYWDDQNYDREDE